MIDTVWLVLGAFTIAVAIALLFVLPNPQPADGLAIYATVLALIALLGIALLVVTSHS